MNPPITTHSFDIAPRPSLDSFFSPQTVALVGATDREGSVGRTVLWNLMNTPFGGPIYPVNPTRPSVLGIKAYPKLANLPEKPDLVVVGHQRRNMLERWWSGPTGAYISDHIHCTLMIARNAVSDEAFEAAMASAAT